MKGGGELALERNTLSIVWCGFQNFEASEPARIFFVASMSSAAGCPWGVFVILFRIVIILFSFLGYVFMQRDDSEDSASPSQDEAEPLRALEELSTDLPVPLLTLLQGLAAVLSDDKPPEA